MNNSVSILIILVMYALNPEYTNIFALLRRVFFSKWVLWHLKYPLSL